MRRSDLDCERRWIVANGGAWFPQKPMLNKDDIPISDMPGPVASELRFTPTENLPAGHLRVLTRDQGRPRRVPRRGAHRRYAEGPRGTDCTRLGV